MSSNPLRVFISWSGLKSRCVADALIEWLPCLIDNLQFWFSSDDLRAGQRWNAELSEALSACHFGIVVITPDSMLSPWVTFEAGALSKNAQQSRVVPYLVDIDITDLSGPLAQFQAVAADRNGTLKLVEDLCALRQPEAATVGAISKRFTKFWPELESRLATTADVGTPLALSEQDSIAQLREQIADLGNLVRQLITKPVTRDLLEPLEAAANASLELSAELRVLEGAWRSSSGSHIYMRIINGRLVAPYCYQGNDELTAIYKDWRKLDDYWFARFSWFNGSINGFGFFRAESADRISGTWWMTQGEVNEAISEPPSRDGVHVVWTKLVRASTPRWAERYFAQESRKV